MVNICLILFNLWPWYLLFLTTIFIFQLQSKFENWSLTIYWWHFYFASELFNNLFGDIQSQTYSVHIHLVLTLKVSKHFEQFRLILFFYAGSCVNDAYFQKLFFIVVEYFCFDSDCSFISKLKSIWLQIKYDLLNSLLIVLNYPMPI